MPRFSFPCSATAAWVPSLRPPAPKKPPSHRRTSGKALASRQLRTLRAVYRSVLVATFWAGSSKLIVRSRDSPAFSEIVCSRTTGLPSRSMTALDGVGGPLAAGRQAICRELAHLAGGLRLVIGQVKPGVGRDVHRQRGPSLGSRGGGRVEVEVGRLTGGQLHAFGFADRLAVTDELSADVVVVDGAGGPDHARCTRDRCRCWSSTDR